MSMKDKSTTRHHHQIQAVWNSATTETRHMNHTTTYVQDLCRFNVIEISECECGTDKETGDPLLLNFELYDEE